MYNEDVLDDVGERYDAAPSTGPCEGDWGYWCSGIGQRCFNPFAEEIHNECVWQYLCPECYECESNEI